MLGKYVHTLPAPVGQFKDVSRRLGPLPQPPWKPLPIMNTCMVMHEFFRAPQKELLKDLGKAVDRYFVQGQM